MNKFRLGEYRKHIYKSPSYILAWIGMCVGALIVAYGITLILTDSSMGAQQYHGVIAKLWFGYFQYFTALTNIQLVIFYSLFLFCYRRKLFNSNRFLIFTTSYIILVFFVMWFVMSPIFVFNSTVKTDPLDDIEKVSTHLITPVLFVIFAVFTMKYRGVNKNKSLPFTKTWIYAFIWPLVYFVYLIIINFILMPASIFTWAGDGPHQLHSGHYYISVYNILTNYNHKCLIPVWDASLTQWVYNPSNYDNSGNTIRVIIVPIVLTFYTLENFILTYINNRLNKAYLPYKPYVQTKSTH